MTLAPAVPAMLAQGQNIELEARLVEREREIEQLKFSLDRLSDRSLEAALALVGRAGWGGVGCLCVELLAWPALAWWV